MIKEVRDIETNKLTGYEFNGMHVPLDSNNRFYRKIKKLVTNGETIEPAYTKQDRLEYFKNKVLSNIDSLADKKHKEAWNYIAGQKVSDLQVQRYKTKYNEAIKAIADSNYNYFELEAELLNMKPSDLANLVKQRGDEWITNVNNYIALIEAYRVKSKHICLSTSSIEEFKLMKLFLKHSETLGSETADDIKTLFDKYNSLATELQNGKTLKDLEPIVW